MGHEFSVLGLRLSVIGSGEVRTSDQLVAEAKSLKARYGVTSHKLKGGVFLPEYELECYRAFADALPSDNFRFDPNGVWSTEQAIWFGHRIEDLKNDYLGAALPNLTFAADAHYHHLVDDVIEGGKLTYCHGAIEVPRTPDLGVNLDRDRVAEYHELFKRLGTSPYDQDPLRPGWAPLIPNQSWADPADDRVPVVPR